MRRIDMRSESGEPSGFEGKATFSLSAMQGCLATPADVAPVLGRKRTLGRLTPIADASAMADIRMMIALLGRLWSRRPPAAALAVSVSLLVLVPLYQWMQVGIREWAYGGSIAAELDAPYFAAVVALRSVGAILLAGLLLAVRKSAALWVVIVATWLTGPPLTFLFGGIFALSASLGQRSVPEGWTFLLWSFAFPLFVTACLLGSRRVRQHYGMQAPPREP
jgi:hypothetical protein